jgi:transcriptional repressor NrdR
MGTKNDMKCPYCFHCETTVIDSRDADEQACIRRRRMCEHCQKRFTTYERVEGVDLVVVKKDGQRQQFSRDKLKRGVVKATWKRPISMSQIEELLDEVERKLRMRSTNEVKSWEIGNLVINRLKKIDKLSYLLFASVYRDFGSVEDFHSEIMRLMSETSCPLDSQSDEGTDKRLQA